MVVDISTTEPWVINTYTLIIHRLAVTHNEGRFHPEKSHQICSLKQVSLIFLTEKVFFAKMNKILHKYLDTI